ncbi:MAG TPA: Crp/Fnr family transcriptional regulator [Ohtaekwangia sp.]|nr:Crp/Fnr family transcriptional regulator [Ohtaekwangia sp.]
MNETIQQLISELKSEGREHRYSPKEFFIRAGQIPKKFGIVQTGLFRYYYLTDDGKEFTKVFMPEHNVISAYSAMIAASPACYNIEAIEPSTVIEIDYDHWQKLRQCDSKWDRLLIFLLEKGYSIKEKREREFLLLDAESRYRIFLQEHADLDKRLKQHMIASYLGITPIALSRIRKDINLG